jgi:hypothetical protein
MALVTTIIPNHYFYIVFLIVLFIYIIFIYLFYNYFSIDNWGKVLYNLLNITLVMKTKSFMTFSLVAILLSAVGAISLSTSQSIFAQNTNVPVGPSTTTQSTMATKGNQSTPLSVNPPTQSTMATKGNQNTSTGMNYPSMGTNKQNTMVNSSINLVKSMYQGVASKFNVTLDQAINTAQKAIGNKSNALEATTGVGNGYITYSIILATPDMKFYNVIVDPGNGKVLSSHQLSMIAGMMMMHPGMNNGNGMMGMMRGMNHGMMMGPDNGMMGMNHGMMGMNHGMMMGPDNGMMGMNHGWNGQQNNNGQW